MVSTVAQRRFSRIQLHPAYGGGVVLETTVYGLPQSLAEMTGESEVNSRLRRVGLQLPVRSSKFPRVVCSNSFASKHCLTSSKFTGVPHCRGTWFVAGSRRYFMILCAKVDGLATAMMTPRYLTEIPAKGWLRYLRELPRRVRIFMLGVVKGLSGS